MDSTYYDFPGPVDMAWCPGCGNFSIIKAVKKALTDLSIPRTELVMVSGIGQAAKLPQYMRASFFNGLHGRALPAATAIKASNPGLVVIAESGDGDMYGEGGNHFMHTVRRNPDIVNIVHNNMVYGLTKGQASPTSMRGFVTPLQVNGVTNEPFNPLAVALALGATFVARAYSGDIDRTAEMIKAAILHRGYALVDIFQPCVTFNKVNTYTWYRENTYYLDATYDAADRDIALSRAMEDGPFPLGIFYRKEGKTVFEDNTGAYIEDSRPLYMREPGREKLVSLFEEYR